MCPCCVNHGWVWQWWIGGWLYYSTILMYNKTATNNMILVICCLFETVPASERPPSVNMEGHVMRHSHYSDFIMGETASQITSLTIVYWTFYSDTDQRKHQSSASLAFVWGTHRGPVNSPHKGPVTRKMFPFDDVIMEQFNLRTLNRNVDQDDWPNTSLATKAAACQATNVWQACHFQWMQYPIVWRFIDGLVQDCSISAANALEILQSCTEPSIWDQTLVIQLQTYHLRKWSNETIFKHTF